MKRWGCPWVRVKFRTLNKSPPVSPGLHHLVTETSDSTRWHSTPPELRMLGQASICPFLPFLSKPIQTLSSPSRKSICSFHIEEKLCSKWVSFLAAEPGPDRSGQRSYHSWDQTGWILTFRDSDAVLMGLGAGEQGGGMCAWRQQMRVENPVPE